MSLSRKKTVLKTGRQSTGRKRQTSGETGEPQELVDSGEWKYRFNDQSVTEEEYNKLIKDNK